MKTTAIALITALATMPAMAGEESCSVTEKLLVSYIRMYDDAMRTSAEILEGRRISADPAHTVAVFLGGKIARDQAFLKQKGWGDAPMIENIPQ